MLDISTINNIFNDAVFFPITIKGVIKNGVLKKEIIPVKDWNNLQEAIKDETRYTTGVGIKLGQQSGLYVLDLDNKDDFDIIRKKYPEIQNCYVITKKGYHIYFEWTKKTQDILGSRNFKKENGYISDIDFLGNNKMTIAPPSFYEYDNNKFQYKYGSTNKPKKMTLELMNYLLVKYQTKNKKELKIAECLDKILNQHFQTDYIWNIEEQENSYKITNNATECLIQGEHSEPSHSCIYANFNGEIFLYCFSHGKKKVNIPDLVKYLQLNIKDENNILNYYYGDYKNFESNLLVINGTFTPHGKLFKKYYKSVFRRVDNNGRPLYFCKIKNGNNDEYKAIKDSPFSSKSSIFYIKISSNGKTVTEPITNFIKYYITSEDIQTYDNIDFIPFLKEQPKTDKKILNTFSGYTFKYEENGTIKEDIQELMDTAKNHIEEIICDGDKKTIKYFYEWLAHLLQKPTSKDGIPAIILKSGQGTGKNLICNFICNIINPAYTIILTNFDKLTGKFNNVLENKLLTICNEISSFGGDFKQNDKLKSIITDTKQIIEPKGQDAYSINNYSRFIFLTNNDWPVKIEKDDRRYFCMKVSDSMKGNQEYYKKVAEAYENKEVQKAFFNYFTNYDLKGVNIRNPPMSKLKAEMKWRNRDNLPIKHLTEYINDNEDFYETNTLYQEFKDWCITEGEKPNITLRSYSLILSKFDFEKVRKRTTAGRPRGFTITKELLKSSINKYIDEDYKTGDDVE